MREWIVYFSVRRPENVRVYRMIIDMIKPGSPVPFLRKPVRQDQKL